MPSFMDDLAYMGARYVMNHLNRIQCWHFIDKMNMNGGYSICVRCLEYTCSPYLSTLDQNAINVSPF